MDEYHSGIFPTTNKTPETKEGLMKRMFGWMFVGGITLLFLSFGVLATADEAENATPDDIRPTAIRAKVSRIKPILPWETAILSGQVVYDQRFSIHWDQVRYGSSAFSPARFEVGVPTVAQGSDGLFYDAVRF